MLDKFNNTKIGKLVSLVANLILHVLYLLLISLKLTKKSVLPTKRNAIKNKPENTGIERLIIIDDDVGFYRDIVWKYGSYILPWVKITDPDGGLELIYALREPNVRVLGITTIMGCANTEICVQAANRVLKVLGLNEIPVLIGARSPSDLGVETKAARFIIDAVMNNPGKVEIIATGPLTNIATAMMLEPKLPKYWRKLHFATGEFRKALGETSDLYVPTILGFSDLNTNMDVKATQYILNHGGAFPIYPNEIMDDIFLNRTDYKLIIRAGTSLGDFVAYELRIANFISNYFVPFSKGIATHGVIPTGLALDPSYECECIESAVVMKDFGYQGCAFVLSNDQDLPKHKIYVKLKESSKERMHRTLINRLC